MSPKLNTPRETFEIGKRLAWVVPQTGSSEGDVFPVEPGHRIGSGPGVEIELREPGVAAAHAEIILREDGWSLEDMGTGKKTVVSDRAVAPKGRAALSDGEPIVLGELKLVFKCL
jgi:pSer/pThr/pTyr-binding forkhead associated (FHA) protein